MYPSNINTFKSYPHKIKYYLFTVKYYLFTVLLLPFYSFENQNKQNNLRLPITALGTAADTLNLSYPHAAKPYFMPEQSICTFRNWTNCTFRNSQFEHSGTVNLYQLNKAIEIKPLCYIQSIYLSDGLTDRSHTA